MPEIRIPELAIEPCDDGTLLLEQDTGGNVDRVQVHPLHFRLAPTGDPTATRTIATLQRRLRLVREEVALLDDWLHAESSADRINLEEMVKARDILTMLDEFIADFEPEAPASSICCQVAQAKAPAATATLPEQPQLI